MKPSWKQQSLFIFLECKLHWVFVHIFHCFSLDYVNIYATFI